jgi:hypothetical protein
MKPCIALVLLIATGCFGQTDSNILATGDWSKPVKDENGVGSTLRGRLLLYDDQVQSAANHARIYVEIQQIYTNGWYAPVEIYCFGTNLVFELKGDHGQSIRSLPADREGLVLQPYWVTVPCDGTVRIRADECTLGRKDKPDGLEILTHDNDWLISPNATNDFYLNCSLRSSTNDPSPLHYDTWRGTLKFPPVKVLLKNAFGLDISEPRLNKSLKPTTTIP